MSCLSYILTRRRYYKGIVIESWRCSFIEVDSLVGSRCRSLSIRCLNVSLVLGLLRSLRVIDIDGQLSKLA